MAAITSGRSKRTPSTRRNRNGKNQISTIKRIAPVVCMMLGFGLIMGIGGRYAVNVASTVHMNDETYCFDDVDYNAVSLFIDYSTTRLYADDGQLRSLRTEFNRHANALKHNQRLDVFTTSYDTVSDVAEPIFSMCLPPSTVAHLEELRAANPSIASYSQPQLNNRTEEATKTIENEIERIITESHTSFDRPKRWNAPLIEQFRSISRYYRDTDVNDFVIFSGGIQISANRWFCKKAGHLPAWENFKRNDPLYNELKLLDGFQNTNVTFLMPRIQDKYQLGKHCQFIELTSWWKSYFLDGGASDVYIQPLHYGVDVKHFDYNAAADQPKISGKPDNGVIASSASDVINIGNFCKAGKSYQSIPVLYNHLSLDKTHVEHHIEPDNILDIGLIKAIEKLKINQRLEIFFPSEVRSSPSIYVCKRTINYRSTIKKDIVDTLISINHRYVKRAIDNDDLKDLIDLFKEHSLIRQLHYVSNYYKGDVDNIIILSDGHWSYFTMRG